MVSGISVNTETTNDGRSTSVKASKVFVDVICNSKSATKVHKLEDEKLTDMQLLQLT